MADWAATGEAYAESFAKLCEGAVPALLAAAAGPTGTLDGVRLLDVGTGPGTVAAAAAARGAIVTGVDPELSMLTAARRRHPDIRFLSGMLPELPFAEEQFAAVTANFVLNHVPDPALALGDLRRVTVAGGVIAVTAWPPGNSPLRPLWREALELSGAGAYPPDPVPEDEPRDRTEDGLLSLLRDAGLAEVRVELIEWTFAIAPDDLWRGVEGGVAGVGAIYRSLGADGRRALRAAYVEVARARAGTDGMLRIPHTAILASGRRP